MYGIVSVAMREKLMGIFKLGSLRLLLNLALKLAYY